MEREGIGLSALNDQALHDEAREEDRCRNLASLPASSEVIDLDSCEINLPSVLRDRPTRFLAQSYAPIGSRPKPHKEPPEKALGVSASAANVFSARSIVLLRGLQSGTPTHLLLPLRCDELFLPL